MQQQRSWQSILQKVLGTAPALITAQVATLFYHRENNKFFIFFSLFVNARTQLWSLSSYQGRCTAILISTHA